MDQENRRYQLMTETEFYGVKSLLNTGASVRSIADQTGRGTATIWIIKKAKDFTEYQAIRSEYSNNAQGIKKTAQAIEQDAAEQDQDVADESATGPKTWKQLTEQDFYRMKAMENLQIPKTKIAELVGKSYSATGNILRSNSWPEYQAYLKKLRDDRQAKLDAEKTPEQLFVEKPSFSTPSSQVVDAPMHQIVANFREDFEALDAQLRKMGY